MELTGATSYLKRAWRLSEPDESAVATLAMDMAVDPVLARLLILRDIDDPEVARRFLEASLRHMADPAIMADMDRAARRLVQAMERSERVTIYGDYDVDGVTSTAVIWLFFLEVFGVKLETYIPHRLKEGYGLNMDAIDRLVDGGTQVLVTVDNGSSANAEIERATAAGVDVVIIDHHQVSDPEPEAYAHLNPHRKGCTYPSKGLAAVGLAFMLLVQVRRVLRDAEFYSGPDPRPDRLLDLVALGTVADVAPLRDINRAIVRYGVNLIKKGPRVGMSALLDVVGKAPSELSARDLGYRLGPRINAAGRLDDATRGLRLLIGDDVAATRQLAREVEEQNKERRAIQDRMVDQAMALIETNAGFREASAIVLADDEWHPGVVGIVAARIVDQYHKPAIVLALDGGVLKGSARSTQDVNIKAALDHCAERLMRYGGHVAAAGMTLKPEELDAFRADLCQAVDTVREGKPGLPALKIDAEVGLEKLTFQFIEDIDAMGPFGHMNPQPVFVSRMTRGRTRILRGGHLKLFFDDQAASMEGLAWNMEDCERWWHSGPVDMVYSPTIETWRGRRKIVLRIQDMRPSDGDGYES